MNVLILSSLIISFLAIAYALYLHKKILKLSPGNKKMQELSEYIRQGATTFLKKEYKSMIIATVIVTIVLWFFISKAVAVTFVMGTFFSALAGNVGMRSATRANARTAQAASKSLNDGLRAAFTSGMVVSMVTVGIGLSSVILVYFLFYKDLWVLYGFGLGASLTALFARVGGGIYTKAADVGADLVGKFEEGIPEDDPRNPATIADNVGDNVGDIAGMGADLFESYVESIIASMILGVIFFGEKGVILPIIITAAGIISTFVGSMFVSAKKDKLYMAIDKGTFASAAVMIVFAFVIMKFYMNDLGLFYATIAGLIAGVVIGYSTEYMTSTKKRPTQLIAEAALTGPATCLIRGIAISMGSTVVPMLVIAFSMLIAYHFGGLYGIAIASVGMLSIVGMSLAADAYGPIADNAAGISEMAKLSKVVRERTETLDEVGNTMAAECRGLQLGTSALTVLALFASFLELTRAKAGLDVINLGEPEVIAGLFIGAIIPFIFSSLVINAVGKAASEMVLEIRRQFRKNKDILKGKAKPDYNKCISISTDTALKDMILPGIIALVVPVIIGLWSLQALGGFLMGTISVGIMLAMFMSNAGCSWDNAKKYIEQGHFGGKGSAAHKASIIGDTVGDPLKDTAGPSIDILIKIVITSALVFLPLFI
ncbi:MAG: sodium-translocating pyrophosphatase [Nanoarchaeota archaeon]|nr:sodium-translocating pyrophosphatase [Nanoarchaeota archaeon]